MSEAIITGRIWLLCDSEGSLIENIDTDQIIPARFLKTTDKSGLGDNLFSDWRYEADGSPKPDFILNQRAAQGAEILLAGDNFGCGSSREHAPWALEDYGFRAILAPSFADIFYNNCFKNGLLPIRLTEQQITDLFRRVRETRGYEIAIDLCSQKISDDFGLSLSFVIEPFRREYLLKGLDDIGLTLQHEQAISRFESRRGRFGQRHDP